MIEVVLIGLINGIGYALLAVGIVLVYKAQRFINIAQAQLGVLAAIILSKLVVDHGWPYWAAFPIAIALGGVVGASVDVFIIRRLAGRSATSLLIVTIGVAEVLLSLGYIKQLVPDATRLVTQGYPIPFDVQIHVGAFLLRGQHLLILTLGPAAMMLLAAALRLTLIGKTIRAAASNPDSASLAGISVKRVSTIAWTLAGLLSAVTAILLAPSQPSYDAATFGPALLLPALGAAALGGLSSFPWAVSAGVLLGIVEAVAFHETGDGGTALAVLFGVVMIGLLMRAGVWRDTSQVPEYTRSQETRLRLTPSTTTRFVVRHQRRLLIAAGIFLGGIAPFLPVFRDAGRQFDLTLILVFALVAVSLVILSGWTGQLSLGQFAFIGVGAYITARLVPHHWSLLAIMVVAGLTGSAIALVVGLPSVGLRGPVSAVTTIGFAVVAPVWLFNQSWFTGADPTRVVAAPELFGLGPLRSVRTVYFVSLAVLVVVMTAVASLSRSNRGRLFVAVRDNELGTSALGTSPSTLRLSAWALSGFLASIAGVLWASAFRTVSPTLFSANQSLLMLSIVVVGGLWSLPGAILGSVVVFGIPLLTIDLGKYIFPNTTGFSLFLAGGSLILIQLQAPTGLAGSVRKLWEGFVNTALRKEPASPTEDWVLQVEELRFSYAGIPALDGVSIKVRAREIVGLIGTNGAGKTTLLNAIAGVIKPQLGTIQLFGQDVTRMPAELRAHLGVARTFQDARLFPGLTVRETLQIAQSRRDHTGLLSSLLGAPWARNVERKTAERAAEMIDRFGLRGWEDHLTSELSMGLRRICDIAAQSIVSPQLILLDEPTAGIAQRESEAFGPLLLQLRDELDCTILIVEHDMPLMLGLADRIYCLETGKVIAEGTADEIVRNQRVVASYLGAPPGGTRQSRKGVAASRNSRKVRGRTRSEVTPTGGSVLRGYSKEAET